MNLFDSIESGDSAGRLEIWSHAINSFINSNVLEMIFGHGYGSFKDVVSYFGVGRNYAYISHNVYMQTLIEGGIIGESLLFLSFLKAYKYSHLNHNLVGEISLIGLMVSSIFIDMQATRLFGFVFMVAYIRKSKPD